MKAEYYDFVLKFTRLTITSQADLYIFVTLHTMHSCCDLAYVHQQIVLLLGDRHTNSNSVIIICSFLSRAFLFARWFIAFIATREHARTSCCAFRTQHSAHILLDMNRRSLCHLNHFVAAHITNGLTVLFSRASIKRLDA